MNKQVIDDLNEVSAEAISELKNYFRSSDNTGKKADRALILLGRINGMESVRVQKLALQFQIAKAVGLRGEPLRPLLVELTEPVSQAQEEVKQIEGN